MEAGYLAADDRLLFDRLGEVVGGGGGLRNGVLADDHLDQRHHRGWVEKVEADHLVGAQRRLGHLGDRERRGVGGEDRVAGGGGVDLAEDRLLDRHLLRHRLDHEVDVAELLVGGGPRDVAHDLGEAGVGLLLGQLLLLDQAPELALGDRAGLLQSGVDELLVDVLDDYGDVGGGDRLCDLPTHRAAADDGGLGNEHCGLSPPGWLGSAASAARQRRLYGDPRRAPGESDAIATLTPPERGQCCNRWSQGPAADSWDKRCRATLYGRTSRALALAVRLFRLSIKD